VENDEVSVPLHPYGISAQTESSWEDCLSDAHLEYVLTYLEQVRAREEAVVSQFLAARER
jgi:hypothetical protein